MTRVRVAEDVCRFLEIGDRERREIVLLPTVHYAHGALLNRILCKAKVDDVTVVDIEGDRSALGLLLAQGYVAIEGGSRCENLLWRWRSWRCSWSWRHCRDRGVV